MPYCKRESNIRLKARTIFSNNIKKAYLKLTLLHKRKADIRNDFLHQVSTLLVKNHDVIVIEDLKVRNMSKSAQGSIANPGTKVKAKSGLTGLNRSILNEAWHKFFTYLEYKLKLKGGILIKVNPQTHESNLSSMRAYKQRQPQGAGCIQVYKVRV